MESPVEIYAIAEVRFRDLEFVTLLGESGCRQAYFGLESVDPVALRIMGKGINRQKQFSEIFRSCADAGIHVYTYTLFGYPGIPPDAESATLEFLLREMSLGSVTIASYVPVAGSPFALEHTDEVVHDGSMTEDFSSIVIEGEAIDVSDVGTDSAERAVLTLYKERRDLALTSLLNDEMRFTLSRRFGAGFAQDALGSGIIDWESGSRQSRRSSPLTW